MSWVIEVTTFRSDVYVADSRKPQVRFGDTLEGDLVRRDFTVNAMAVELPEQAVRGSVRGSGPPGRAR